MDMNRKQFLGSLLAGATAGCIPAFACSENGTDEFERCRNDILYFVDNYLEVTDNLHGKLKMNEQQREYLKRISTAPDYFFCAKGRQVGISTANKLFAYWKSIFFGPDHRVFIVEPNRAMCRRMEEKYRKVSNSGMFLPMVNLVHFLVPEWLRGIDWHDKNYTFILDEFAFWSDDEVLKKEVCRNLMNAWFKNEIKPETYGKYACNFIVASTPADHRDFFSTLMSSINDDSMKLVLPSPTRGLKA